MHGVRQELFSVCCLFTGRPFGPVSGAVWGTPGPVSGPASGPVSGLVGLFPVQVQAGKGVLPSPGQG